MKFLFSTPSLKVLSFLSLVLQTGLFLSPFLIFPLQIQILVESSSITQHSSLSFLKIIFKHSSHPIEFLCLLMIHHILIFFLFRPLSLFLHLLIQPLFLLVLEELPTSIILYISNNQNTQIFALEFPQARHHVGLIFCGEITKVSLFCSFHYFLCLIVNPSMKTFYTQIDKLIKDPTSTPSQILPELLRIPQSQQKGELFDLPQTIEYILRRIINGNMSTDQKIRSTSANALQQFRKLYPAITQANKQKLLKFVLDASYYKRYNVKKNQSEGFALGRLAVLKELGDLLGVGGFEAAREVFGDFVDLEEQALQTLFCISNSKLTKLKFLQLQPKTQSAKFLHKLLIHKKQPSQKCPTITQAETQVTNQLPKFPQRSVSLQYLGHLLPTLASPASFFQKYSKKFLNEDQVDIHQIYYILVILRSFLKTVKISQENCQQYFDRGIIAVWLEQLRVMNKNMKGLANTICIQFERDCELAYGILVELHQSDIYLDNISVKHPLAALYEYVDVGKYWLYISELCASQYLQIKNQKPNQQQIQQQQQQNQSENSKISQQQKFTNFNELCFLLQHHHSQLSDTQILTSITLFLNLYHNAANSKQNPIANSKHYLFILTNIFNHLFEAAAKKKKNVARKVHVGLLNLLMKVQWEAITQIQDQEAKGEIKKCVLWLKKKVIKDKKVNSELVPAEIGFYNFYISLLFFTLIYPEQLQTCQQLHMVQKDLQKLHETEQPKPKKKIKKNKQQSQDDAKKPIHVLIDIFVSLMTKPPKFLRKSIHELYELLIPYLDQTDLGNLLAVVTTPDAQFIEQM